VLDAPRLPPQNEGMETLPAPTGISHQTLSLWQRRVKSLVLIVGTLSGVFSLVLGGYLFFSQRALEENLLATRRQQLNEVAEALAPGVPKLMRQHDVFYDIYPLAFLQALRESLQHEFRGDGDAVLHILDQQGNFVYHPDPDVPLQARNALEESSGGERRQLEEALQGKRQQLILQGGSLVRGWALLAPLPDTPFYAVLLQTRRPLMDPQLSRRLSILLFLGISLLSFALFCRVVRTHTLSVRAAYLFSLGLSLVLIANIGHLWWLTMQPNYSHADNELASDQDLDRFQARLSSQVIAPQSGEMAKYPVGVFVKSVAFLSDQNLRMSGYIWQKFPKRYHLTARPGLIFSDAIETRWQDPLIQNFGDYTLWGSGFDVTIRQELDLAGFPLNQAQLQLKLIPKGFERQVVLVPDLSAYSTGNPGLDPRLFINGWDITRSFFSYSIYRAPTNYGVESLIPGEQVFPELNLEIQVRRQFVGNFITNILATILGLGILFAIFARIAPRYMGDYKPTEIVPACISLQFSLLLAHVQFRNNTLQSSRILYVDYFYFIAYLYILAVIVYFVFLVPRQPRLYRYREALIPKMLYWPVALCLAFGATLFTFW
jgi:hypothetical protein